MSSSSLANLLPFLRGRLPWARKPLNDKDADTCTASPGSRPPSDPTYGRLLTYFSRLRSMLVDDDPDEAEETESRSFWGQMYVFLQYATCILLVVACVVVGASGSRPDDHARDGTVVGTRGSPQPDPARAGIGVGTMKPPPRNSAREGIVAWARGSSRQDSAREVRIQNILIRVARLPPSAPSATGHMRWLPPSVPPSEFPPASHPLKRHLVGHKPAAVNSPRCLDACPAVLDGYKPSGRASSSSRLNASSLIQPKSAHLRPVGQRVAGIVLVHCDHDVAEYLSTLSCSFVRLYIYAKCPKTPPRVPRHLTACTLLDSSEHSPAGMNALSYLEHLVAHYDTLEPVTFFVKDSNRQPFPLLLPELIRASFEADVGYYAFTSSLDDGRKGMFSGRAGEALYDAIFCDADHDWRAPARWRTALHSVFALGRRRAYMWPRCKYAAIVELIKSEFAHHKLDLRKSWMMFEYSWGELWRCRPQAWMQHNFVCVGNEGIAQNQSLFGMPCTRA